MQFLFKKISNYYPKIFKQINILFIRNLYKFQEFLIHMY